MKRNVKTLVALAIFSSSFFSAWAASQNPDDKINADTYRMLRKVKVGGSLNQIPLRECVMAYSELTGIKMVLTKEVNSLPDIAVNVDDDSGIKKPMGEILDSIISVVNDKYKLNLEWTVIDGIVVVKKVSGSIELSDNSVPAGNP